MNIHISDSMPGMKYIMVLCCLNHAAIFFITQNKKLAQRYRTYFFICDLPLLPNCENKIDWCFVNCCWLLNTNQ